MVTLLKAHYMSPGESKSTTIPPEVVGGVPGKRHLDIDVIESY